MITKEKLVLASSSPRRIELLKNGSIDFEVVEHSIDESSFIEKNPKKLVSILSYNKALSVSKLDQFIDRYVIGVDTIVVYKNNILGKPANREEALFNIKRLSGNKHLVVSGIAVVNSKLNIKEIKTALSVVYFNKLNDKFLEYYIDNNLWKGYAGGYAIQGIFSLVIKKIVGSYTNIVGLPMEILYKSLKKLDLIK